MKHWQKTKDEDNMSEMRSGRAMNGSMGQGIMVLLFLMLCAGGAGFFIGFTQKFAPVEKVPPATASEGSSASSPGAEGTSATAPAALKKSYWISTRGYERAGFAIKVYVNDTDAGTFQTPDRLVDVTRFVKLGDNKIRFVAKALPAGNRTDNSNAYFQLALYQGEKYSSKGYKNGEKLVEYERKVTETEDFDDSQDFTIVE